MVADYFSPLSRENEALLEQLLDHGLLSSDQKDILVTEHHLSSRPIESLILELGFMDEDALSAVLGEMRESNLVPLAHLRPSTELRQRLPLSIAESCLSVPISYDEKLKILTVAMADVTDILAYDTLRSLLREDESLVTVSAKKSEILALLQKYKEEDPDESFRYRAAKENQFLHLLLADAVAQNASDIHFQPEKIFVSVRYRCDGLLKTVTSFHESVWAAMCIQLKVLADMDITETRRPQDGRFSLRLLGRPVDFRVSSHPTIYGENLVLRILDKTKSLLSLSDLGYTEHNLAKIHQLIQRPEGLIVLTGPTGSGKTTSLYSMLSLLNTPTLNIMTLEEPVEYTLSGLRQTEVKESSPITFASGMHSLLRQDPDVILLGEIRDQQTAHMAVRAGMTGHQVFTTLHTTHALGAIYRFIEFQVPLSLLAGLLIGIIAQRLIRLLCPQCKRALTLNPQQSQELKLWPYQEVYQAVGCEACQFQGYRGRKAISEIIVMDEAMEEMILSQAAPHELKRHLHQHGFQTLAQDGLSCVASGITSVEEIRRVLGKW